MLIIASSSDKTSLIPFSSNASPFLFNSSSKNSLYANPVSKAPDTPAMPPIKAPGNAPTAAPAPAPAKPPASDPLLTIADTEEVNNCGITVGFLKTPFKNP